MTGPSAGASRIRAPRRPSGALARTAVVLTAALALGACGSSGTGASHTSAAQSSRASNTSAPACLPATLNHSAKLAGVPVDVSPAPGTGTANPHTQISFLGVPVTEIRNVAVVGRRSGRHAGRLAAYSQGDGASFVPHSPFAAGEQVVVHAMIGARAVVFAFRVATPYPTATVGEFANPAAAPADYQSFATLPGVQAPILTVTVPDRDGAAGDIFLTNGPGPGRYGPLIYTPQGSLVWVHQLSDGTTAEDLSVQTYEGSRDLTFWQGKVLSLGFGQGEDIVMNSGYQTVATIRAGNGLAADLHDFQIASHNVAYVTAYNPIRCDLTPAGGSRDGVILDPVVQEIDMKTGLVRWEWHSLEHIGATESETSPPKPYPWDWFHLNSIDPEPNGDILISARNTWASYQIQSGTGNVLWRLGGLESSFKMGPGTETAWQHDARMLANGEVTLFDDGSNPPVHQQSRAVRIALDLKTHEARLVSDYTHPTPPLLAASQGNMQTLANANTVVGYGGVPEVSEYAPDGTLLFDAHLSFDLIFYRAFRFPWSGRPVSPPTVVANLNNTAEETIVHMSWSGATDVAAWRVLAGTRPGSLKTQTTTQSSGFETSTILPRTFSASTAGHSTPGYVAVEALDAAGHVLGTSPAVPVKSYAALLPSPRRTG